jgi:hypothetical protein
MAGSQLFLRYAYALSNPLRYADPLGLFSVSGIYTGFSTAPSSDDQCGSSIPADAGDSAGGLQGTQVATNLFDLIQQTRQAANDESNNLSRVSASDSGYAGKDPRSPQNLENKSEQTINGNNATLDYMGGKAAQAAQLSSPQDIPDAIKELLEVLSPFFGKTK